MAEVRLETIKESYGGLEKITGGTVKIDDVVNLMYAAARDLGMVFQSEEGRDHVSRSRPVSPSLN